MSPETSSHLPAAFRRLAWSNLTAQSAEQIGLAAAPLIAVLLFGAGAGATGLLQMALTLPFLLLTLPAGVMADRTSRRRIMAYAEAVRALSLLCIPLLMVSGLLTLPLLAVLGFVGAAGTVAYSVAAPAIVPALVPRHMLTAANGRLELARSSAFVAGPALAGVIVEWSGASAAYVFATVLSTCAVFLLIRLPEPARTGVARRNVLQELSDGARFVLSHPLLRPIVATAVFFNISWFVLQAVYVVYAIRELGLSASTVGVTLGVYGAGMVAGALIAPVIGRRLSFGTMLVVGPLSGLIAALVMVLTLQIPSVWLAGLSFFLFGLGPIVWVITSTTLRQSVTPNHMLGRASSLVMLATFGARPVGAALGAFIGALYGVQTCLVVAAVGFLVQFILIFISPVSRLDKLPEAVAAAA
jgi:predicted MFS family arabinose efflux permease